MVVSSREARSCPGFETAALAELPRRRPADGDALGPPVFLVTGGTFGSPFLNGRAPILIDRLREQLKGFRIVHQAGIGQSGTVAERYARLGIDAEVVDFDLDLYRVWSHARLALCAAGAGTLADARAAAAHTLVVPIEAVADAHQRANALAVERYGLRWIAESDWTDDAAASLMTSWLHAGPRRAESTPDPSSASLDDLFGLLFSLADSGRQPAAVPAR